MDTSTAIQIAEIIRAATEKSTIDYALLLLQAATPLAVIIFSYVSLRSHIKRVASEKLIEKDIERLYQSTDLFFDYADKINLFYSLEIKYLEKILEEKTPEESFTDKRTSASDAVFKSFESIRKCSLILASLGEKKLSKKIDKYRENSIELRKKIFDLESIARTLSKTEQLQNIETIKAQKEGLIKNKERCLMKISKAHRRYKKTIY